ncbi:MAG: hypothetical protein QM564_11335 [Bergeyella sp.]
MSDIAFGEDATELFQKHPEIFFKSEKAKADFDKAKLSPENAKKLEKITKENAKLAKKREEVSKKQAELERKAAELAAEQAKLSGRNVKSIIFKDGTYKSEIGNNNLKPDIFIINGDRIKYLKNGIIEGDNLKIKAIPEDIKIYVDGILVPNTDLKDIDPKSVKQMIVTKKDENGKKVGEIRVETKK